MTAEIEPLRLSNSKANTWRRCPRQFKYKYEDGLRPRAKALPLERGTWLHTLLEVYYARNPLHNIVLDRSKKAKPIVVGTDWRKAHTVLTKAFNNLFDEEKEDLGDLPAECLRIFTSYLMRYGKEDARWKVIDTELDEIVTLPSGLLFQVIIDLIVQEPDGGIWIVDHKTVGRFMSSDFMLIDAQLARYFWAAEHMGYGPLRGIMFNEVNTTPPTLPKLLPSNNTLEKRANLRCDVYTYLREIKRHRCELDPHKDFLRRLRSQQDLWFRRTRLPKDQVLIDQLMRELEMTADEIRTAQAKQAFPRTAKKECTFDCSFLHLCQVELMGGDAEHIIKSRFSTRKERDL